MYDSVSSNSFYEFEYENVILDRASLLFPEYHAVPFKKRVESETGRAIADLALIERSYRKWWVVEIELSHHSLSGHVLPQVDILANANYGTDIAQYLASRSSDLDIGSLENMMRGSQPLVVVIVDRYLPDWV